MVAYTLGYVHIFFLNFFKALKFEFFGDSNKGLQWAHVPKRRTPIHHTNHTQCLIECRRARRSAPARLVQHDLCSWTIIGTRGCGLAVPVVCDHPCGQTIKRLCLAHAPWPAISLKKKILTAPKTQLRASVCNHFWNIRSCLFSKKDVEIQLLCQFLFVMFSQR
jgi:hypothetical protein